MIHTLKKLFPIKSNLLEFESLDFHYFVLHQLVDSKK